ncbi:MAG: CPBP family intramembrane metalloprotease [Hyphomicrobiales bacterium]|nr:CPBP family intramembrane metalloprotease [Hyphomicrobiales bacterium]
MSRYVSLFVLLVIVFVACAAVEFVLHATGAGVSLRDTKGIGQVSLFLIIIPILVIFAVRRGGGPAVFLKPYLANLPRALAGFGAMWAQAVVLMAIAYGLLGLMGFVSWSSEAWASFSMALLGKTIVALLVVIVLAYTEEHIFRAFVFRHLRYDETPRVTVAAIVVAAALFSVTHLISYKDSWALADVASLLFGLFLLGGLFIVTYIASGSLACAIGMHAGLLGFKVFLRRTDLLDYQPDVWWLGGSEDIRLAPITWLLMVLIGIFIWVTRRQLRRHFYIEPAVAPLKPGKRA